MRFGRKLFLKHNSVALAVLLWASGAMAQTPLSAIDWLEQQNSVPLAEPRISPAEEPPVTSNATTPGVEVTPLGEIKADAVGLLPTATTGLPRSLWSASANSDLIALLEQASPKVIPAVQSLLYTLLLAEADPPTGAGNDASFLKARVHTLVRFGAVDPARALIERAGPKRKSLFNLWLSLSLLSGDEDTPCALLADQPTLSTDYAARVFCIARAGHWDTAALTFDTANAINALDAPVATLLAQFLDPELVETNAQLAPPQTPTPLVFRLYEANGSPLPTRRLPRAYAMADLRGTAGWKAELEAAERLARSGALPATRLLGLYTERSPAASGGIWDRVHTIQAFDKALFSRDPEMIGQTLSDAWKAALDHGLAVPFAQLFAEQLMEVDLPDNSHAIAYRIALLSPEYESAAKRYTPETQEEKLFASVAEGEPDASLAQPGFQTAIITGLSVTEATPEHQQRLDKGKLGEAILMAALQLGEGRLGRERDLREGLATLRAVGLEDSARRAALQLLILGGTP